MHKIFNNFLLKDTKKLFIYFPIRKSKSNNFHFDMLKSDLDLFKNIIRILFEKKEKNLMCPYINDN